MNEIRETEKLYCEYIFWGFPKKPFRYFLKFRLKKGLCPTVYAEKNHFSTSLFGLAFFIKASGLERDGLALDLLKRHAEKSEAKQLTLIPAPEFEGLVNRNKEELEALFLIRKSEEI